MNKSKTEIFDLFIFGYLAVYSSASGYGGKHAFLQCMKVYVFGHKTMNNKFQYLIFIKMDKIDLFRAFYTQSSKYYADKLDKFDNGKKYSFNFWAGFLGIVWFCYRKMYLQGFIIFLVAVFIAIITKLLISLINPNDLSNALYNQFLNWILSFVILGFLGNVLYIKKSKKVVGEFISKHDLENIDNSKVNILREKGGTSVTAAIMCAGLFALIQILAKLYT